jgi:hypothetical protein
MKRPSFAFALSVHCCTSIVLGPAGMCNPGLRNVSEKA